LQEDVIKGIIYNFTISSIIISVCTLIFLLFISNFFSKKIVNPIIELKNSAKKIAQGNYNIKIKAMGDYEIRDLTISLNNMIENLKKSKKETDKYNQELNILFNEKKEELDKKIRELNNSNKAMMNMMADSEEMNKKLAKAQTQLKKHITKLKIMDKKKDEFISIIAHELKTPLTSIRGFSDLLQNKAFVNNLEKRNKSLSIIYKETARLEKLINDILDLSRIDLGTMKFSFEKVNPQILIKKVKDHVDLAIKQKGLTSKYEVEKNLPLIVIDEDRIIQVISNLINNSVKYTEKGGKITIKAYKRDGYIVFKVSDTGIGIPKGELERIFDRFYQVDSSYTRKVGGSGLGLSICKGIVESLGGEIFVESNIGQGSSFRFTLPLKSKKVNQPQYIDIFEEKTKRRVLKKLGENPNEIKIINLIISSVEKLIGPLAIAAARQIKGMIIKNNKVVRIERNPGEIISELIKSYEKVVGPIGNVIIKKEKTR